MILARENAVCTKFLQAEWVTQNVKKVLQAINNEKSITKIVLYAQPQIM